MVILAVCIRARSVVHPNVLPILYWAGVYPGEPEAIGAMDAKSFVHPVVHWAEKLDRQLERQLMILPNLYRFAFIYTHLSGCNTSFFEDLFEANKLPVCSQEPEASMAYLAGLVDDIQPDALSKADSLKWFQILAGNKYTSGKIS